MRDTIGRWKDESASEWFLRRHGSDDWVLDVIFELMLENIYEEIDFQYFWALHHRVFNLKTNQVTQRSSQEVWTKINK